MRPRRVRRGALWTPAAHSPALHTPRSPAHTHPPSSASPASSASLVVFQGLPSGQVLLQVQETEVVHEMISVFPLQTSRRPETDDSH